jgi:hypothetical protein
MVEGVRPGGSRGGPSSVPRGDPRRSGVGFLVDPGGGDSNIGAPRQNARLSTVPAIGLDNLLALQAIGEATERDRFARKRGGAMIAALTDLQRAMLAEEDPSLALSALSQLATDGALADDPALGAILRAIVLRSRVEVARRGRPEVKSSGEVGPDAQDQPFVANL